MGRIIHSKEYYEESRVRYNKIKDEYNRIFDSNKFSVLQHQGVSKEDLDFMSSELLIKISNK